MPAAVAPGTQLRDALERILRGEKLDFIQIHYSVNSTNAARTVLPLAQDKGVAVLVNRAFDDGKLFARVKDVPLPGWAAEAGVMVAEVTVMAGPSSCRRSSRGGSGAAYGEPRSGVFPAHCRRKTSAHRRDEDCAVAPGGQ